MLSPKSSLALILASLLLAACGGGSSQIEPFVPTRIISFGDETSTLLADGKKFTINGFKVDTKELDCRVNPVWTQTLASNFGMVFSQCNVVNPVANPQAQMLAAAGDKVATVRAKLDAHFAADRFGPKDLVTIMVGMNDVLELYAQFPQQSREALVSEAKARGKALGEQVNRVANANGRVLVSTIYDLGVTPFGLNEKATKTDIDRAAFLDELSSAFNVAMRLALINDGRLIGLVLADETIQQIVRFPGAFGYSDVTRAACKSDVAVQNCTPDTLVTDAATGTWLWANDRLLTPAAHGSIGSQAIGRARNNPF